MIGRFILFTSSRFGRWLNNNSRIIFFTLGLASSVTSYWLVRDVTYRGEEQTDSVALAFTQKSGAKQLPNSATAVRVLPSRNYTYADILAPLNAAYVILLGVQTAPKPIPPQYEISAGDPIENYPTPKSKDTFCFATISENNNRVQIRPVVADVSPGADGQAEAIINVDTVRAGLISIKSQFDMTALQQLHPGLSISVSATPHEFDTVRFLCSFSSKMNILSMTKRSIALDDAFMKATGDTSLFEQIPFYVQTDFIPLATDINLDDQSNAAVNQGVLQLGISKHVKITWNDEDSIALRDVYLALIGIFAGFALTCFIETAKSRPERRFAEHDAIRITSFKASTARILFYR